MNTITPSSSVRKKRSPFSLPSFRKPAPPAPAAPPISTEQAIKARKAAAWQWLTRGIDDVVVPTKHPTPQQSLPPDHPMQLPASAAASPEEGGIVSTHRNQQTPIMPRSPKDGDEFAASPSTSSPLIYDEFELSGLRAHMAADVMDLQKLKSNPHCAETAEGKKVASIVVAPVAPSHGIHSNTHVSSALHKFFNKVNFTGSIMKNSKKSARAPRVLAMPNETPPDNKVNGQEDVQYHYHHCIHHHHHHYHYSRSPDEVGAVIGRRRRHSESSQALRPYIPSLRKAAEDEDDDEVESPIKTFLHTRSRQHSENFLRGCYMQRKFQDSTSHADELAMMGESVFKSSPQISRRYNSATFTTSPNKP